MNEEKLKERIEKLKAENTMLKSNNLALEEIIKVKNKDMDSLRSQIKDLNKKIQELKDNSNQIDIFGEL